MQIFYALVELRKVFSAKVSASIIHHKLMNTHVSYYIYTLFPLIFVNH